MPDTDLRDLTTYRAAAARYAREVPRGRSLGRHLEIVWMNFRDVFNDNHYYFLVTVAGAFPRYEIEKLAADLARDCE